MNLKNEFVPYEQALALKELGFDEPCFGHYQQEWDDDEINELEPSLHMIFSKQHQHAFQVCTAPTFSQSFRWFKEKYNLIPDIQYYGNWNFEIFRIGEFAEPMDDVNVDYTFKGGTYEESELECLKKLIEIVKEK